MLLRSMSLSLAIVASAAFVAPAHAADDWAKAFAGSPPTPKSITISYSDLDVSREAGARILLGRIIKAADSVCGYKPGNIGDFARQNAYRACMNDTVGKGVQSANVPLVAQIYGKGEGMTASTGSQ